MHRILLVEDNEMNRDMLSRRLRSRGYDVVIAVDGEIGLAMAKSETPDLILMDMSLPVIDGWEATRTLKESDATKHIPVIALTAHAMSTDREKAMEAGCDDYDTKPIELPRLLGKMEALLGASAKVPPLELADDLPPEIKEAVHHMLPPDLLHDLRTPLGHIIGYSELLIEQVESSGHPEFVPYLEKIRKSGRQLLEMMTNNFESVAQPERKTKGKSAKPAAPG